MEIKCYLNDGACWQAQCALAYLRYAEETIKESSWNERMGMYLASIHVGRFENCREQGYVFSVKTLNHPDRQGNWVVYEHRNVDHAMCFFFNGTFVNTPTLDEICDMMDNGAYVEKKDFGYDINAMMQWLKKDMTEWVDDCMAD